MRNILVVLLCLIGISSTAQIYQNRPEYGWRFNRIKIDSTLTLPKDTSLRSNVLDPGAIVYNMGDSAIYTWNGSYWNKISSGQTPNLYNSDGDLTGNRTLNGKGYNLTLDSLQQFILNTNGQNMQFSAYKNSAGEDSMLTTGADGKLKLARLQQDKVEGLVDSLDKKLTWDSPLTPMLTQLGIPIQPTTSLIKALPQLQQQINDFTGKFIEVNPAVSQPGVNAKMTGTMNMITTSGNGYGFNIERPDNISYDAALGYRVGGSVVGFAGLGNRNNNDYSIQFLTSRTRLVNADTSGIQFIGVSRYGGLRMWGMTKNNRLLLGDSMQASFNAIAKIDIQASEDTSVYAKNKMVTDINLTTTDSSHLVANTKFVKDQITGYNSKYVQLSPAAAQSGAALNLTGNITLNRPNSSSVAAYSIVTAGIQTGYVGAASIGSNSMVVTASNGPLALYAPDSTSLNVTSYGAVTPGNTFIKARGGKTVFGDSLASNVFGRYPLDIISVQDTSIRSINRIVQDYNLSLADNSKTVVTSSWIVSQGFLKSVNATWQAATTTGNTTSNIIKVTGSTGSLAGTNGGLEMFWDGTSSVLQSYDRVAVALKPMKLSASTVNIVAGMQLPIRTVTTTTTATVSDYTILVNNSGAATINLPASASSSGLVLAIKKLSAASNDVTITPASGTIDGGASKVLTLQNSSVTIQCNGTNWYIIASHANATTL